MFAQSSLASTLERKESIRSTVTQQGLPSGRGAILQRKCACGGTPGPSGKCEECRKKREGDLLQRRVSSFSTPIPHATEAPPIVHAVLRSPGRPLDPTVRAHMEPRFGQDFSHVRVHTDAQATESAGAVQAMAYTVGRDVVFGAGHYQPSTNAGRQLIAHELSHVVQQRSLAPMAGALRIGRSDDALEAEADSTAHPFGGPARGAQTFGGTEPSSNHSIRLQRKLAMGSVNDSWEQEADRIAAEVMANPAVRPGASQPRIQRLPAAGAGPAEEAAPLSLCETLARPGTPLQPDLRQDMENRFGYDFSSVRVHTDAAAARSADEVGARAYTVEKHVVFADGQFSPSTGEGRRLMAHELTHVAQQTGGATAVQRAPARDQRWRRDQNAARLRGKLMAKRIRTHTKVSREARAKMTSELQYFEGAAKTAYLQEIRPALKSVNEIAPGDSVPKPRPVTLDSYVAPDQRATVSNDTVYAPLADLENRETAELDRLREQEIQKLEQMMDDDEWPKQFREFALNLLIPLVGKTVNIDSRAVSDRIRGPILRAYRQWMEAQDQIRKKVCEKMPGGAYGFILKSQAKFHPELDPCIPWFKDEYSHGPSELRSLESLLRLHRLDSTGEESPAEYIYWDVFQYRKKTDPYMLQQEQDAASMVSGLGNMVTAGEGGPGQAIPAENLESTSTTPAAEQVPAPPSSAEAVPPNESSPSPTTGNTIVASPPPPPARPPRQPAATTIRSSPPPVPNKTGAPASRASGASPVTDAELVAGNVRDPSSIKVSDPKSHQEKWANLGGGENGKAPSAYRTPDGTIHVSSDHPLMAPASRAGIPPVSPADPHPSAPSPSAPATPTRRPAPGDKNPDIGTADTGEIPAGAPPAPSHAKQSIGTADTGQAPAPGPAPAPAPKPSVPKPPAGPETREFSNTDKGATDPRVKQAGKQIDPPQPITPEAVDRMRHRPSPPSGRKGRGNNVNYSQNGEQHQLAWQRLGGHEKAPPAFIYDGQVYLDPSRWR